MDTLRKKFEQVAVKEFAVKIEKIANNWNGDNTDDILYDIGMLCKGVIDEKWL